jgi:hydroxypyruvate isomerase
MNDAREYADVHRPAREGLLGRRDLLAGAATLVSAAMLPSTAWGQAQTGKVVMKGRIQQAICGGCLRKLNLDTEKTASLLAGMGLAGMDFAGRNDWPILQTHGLVATLVAGAGSIKKGLNDRSLHAALLNDFRTNIKAAAEYRWPNVITMAGDRAGISDEQGMDNCQAILKEAVKMAEDSGVTICMELLNSKVDHAGYMCDRSAWGFELCRRVDSPRFKLLYDIYHMQIMEGDLIATIRKNIRYIGHFHTAGVPGRHELDENQEIFYPAVMRAIAETGYQGYVAHEYSPVRDPMESFVQAVKACDV